MTLELTPDEGSHLRALLRHDAERLEDQAAAFAAQSGGELLAAGCRRSADDSRSILAKIVEAGKKGKP